MQENNENNENDNNMIALDIGGTLTKLCFVTNQKEVSIPHDPLLTIKLNDKTFFFNYFKHIEDCWTYIRTYFKKDDKYCKFAITGGGAYKFSQQLQKISKQLNKKIQIIQEFQSLVAGLNFFKVHPQYLQFNQTYITQQQGKSKFQVYLTSYHSIQNSPILIVNIGSGVSLLLVENNENNQLKASRVGGTSLGGGFFMGLANLLTGQNNFNKLLQMGQKGNVSLTDFTPIDFPEISDQLSEASVLVSLGKLNKQSNPNDIVKSLFYMVTFNIAQIALSLSQIKNVKHVLFTGCYCRGNNYFLHCFAQAFNFFSKKKSPRFVYSMIHDGFLGTLGSLHLELSKQK